MMNRLTKLLVTFAIGLAVGCDREPSTTQGPSAPPPPTAPTAPAKADDHDHDHAKADKSDTHEGEKHDLGTQEAGDYSVKATQIGEIKGGTEVVFELAIAGGIAKPTAVRAWVGTETGEGSARSKAEAGESDFHVHIELPATLPANSKFWAELETSTGRHRASFALPKDDHDHGGAKTGAGKSDGV